MNIKNNYLKRIIIIIITTITIVNFNAINTIAFPIYAQQGYENPREATGRIVCANCHLAQKPVSIEIPKSVLPNSVFEAKVIIPYDKNLKQISGTGKEANLNTGAVIILPEGFKLAPKKILSDDLKAKTKSFYIQPYSTLKQNILVVGPVPGYKNQEIIFPILSPDPSQDKDIHFLKYPVYVGGNRGRGQIYPTGEKSNNNAVNATYDGKVISIKELEDGNLNIEILKNNGETYIEKIPKGLKIKIKEGNNIKASENLTNDPNIGGFGQNESEIVLQDPNRIKGMIVFFILVTLAQIFFVLKKKQWEKVQSAEINF
uniref:Cytochrome f n=1 Tax=Thuretia quercifolia TaxID=189650 RepID=A0A1Z1MKQ7_9FLOR|nr:Apocytochrome f [Thuretia quercifolia]ARW66432.1 Apocytochrome f [Thuretia quercifolia]